jgi:O-antigen/teichoic acid export membrane protein
MLERLKKLLRQGVSNTVVQYIFSRYIIYALQFVNSLLIAAYLGPYYLGIWGFINLVIQYFLQFNLGISHSFNAIVAIHKDDKSSVENFFANSNFLILILSLVAGLIFLALTLVDAPYMDQYQMQQYKWWILAIAMVNYYLNLFTNLFRIFNQIKQIAIVQAIFPVATTVCLFFARESQLVHLLVVCNFISLAASLIYFIIQSPIKLGFSFRMDISRRILKTALPLFLYNSSFYLILISTRSILSYYYSVEEFGNFTFSFSMANVIQLLFESFSFLVFPKIINRLSTKIDEEAIALLQKIRNDFMTIAYSCVFIVMPLFPIFLQFFPKYQNSELSFGLNILTVAVYTNCFGFSTFLIAKGRERILGLLALGTLVLNILFGLILVAFSVQFHVVVLASLTSYVIYSVLVAMISLKVINGRKRTESPFLNAFPISYLIPFLVSAVLILFELSLYLQIIPMIIFFILNRSKIGGVIKTIETIIRNPKVTNI